MTTISDLPMLDIDAPATCTHLPVHTEPGGWAANWVFDTTYIYGYHQVREMLTEPHLVAPSIEDHSFGTIIDGPVAEWARNVTSFQDGPVHHELRSPTLALFTPEAVEQYRQAARSAAVAAVSELDLSRPVDLVDAVAKRYPIDVFAAVLGTDPAELRAAAPWVEVMTELWSYDAGQKLPQLTEALPHIDDLARRLTASPAGLAADIERTELAPHRRRALIGQMLVAGWETTSSQAATMLYHLVVSPERWDDLQRYPLEAVVDEVLRFEPTAPMAIRYAEEDVLVAGLEIPKGRHVIPHFMWASRDPNVFDRPDEWDPGRYTSSDPAPPPLVFSAGRHACLGRHLARIELTELARALRDNLSDGLTLTDEPGWQLEFRPRRPVELVVAAR